jgi:hypothetical protein
MVGLDEGRSEPHILSEANTRRRERFRFHIGRRAGFSYSLVIRTRDPSHRNTMIDSKRLPRVLTLWRALVAVLIAVNAWSVVSILPDWILGRPPQYPGQFEGRLLAAIIGIGIIASVLTGTTAFGRTGRGRVTSYALLAFSLGALALKAYSGL